MISSKIPSTVTEIGYMLEANAPAVVLSGSREPENITFALAVWIRGASTKLNSASSDVTKSNSTANQSTQL